MKRSTRIEMSRAARLEHIETNDNYTIDVYDNDGNLYNGFYLVLIKRAENQQSLVYVRTNDIDKLIIHFGNFISTVDKMFNNAMGMQYVIMFHGNRCIVETLGINNYDVVDDELEY